MVFRPNEVKEEEQKELDEEPTITPCGNQESRWFGEEIGPPSMFGRERITRAREEDGNATSDWFYGDVQSNPSESESSRETNPAGVGPQPFAPVPGPVMIDVSDDECAVQPQPREENTGKRKRR